MLCKINRLLTLVILAFIGAFVAHSIYHVIHYHVSPQLRLVSSAPWYTAIIANAFLTTLIAGALLIFKGIVIHLRNRAHA